MVFETVHPIDLHLIAAARVAKVLKRGYFIAEVQCNSPNPNVRFILHITSPFVLPLGFAVKHQVIFVPPTNENPEAFTWSAHIRKFGLIPLDLSVLPRVSRNVNHFQLSFNVRRMFLSFIYY